jgi:hypothetical protein
MLESQHQPRRAPAASTKRRTHERARDFEPGLDHLTLDCIRFEGGRFRQRRRLGTQTDR